MSWEEEVCEKSSRISRGSQRQGQLQDIFSLMGRVSRCGDIFSYFFLFFLFFCFLAGGAKVVY